jgi:hypothetical protein
MAKPDVQDAQVVWGVLQDDLFVHEDAVTRSSSTTFGVKTVVKRFSYSYNDHTAHDVRDSASLYPLHLGSVWMDLYLDVNTTEAKKRGYIAFQFWPAANIEFRINPSWWKDSYFSFHPRWNLKCLRQVSNVTTSLSRWVVSNITRR